MPSYLLSRDKSGKIHIETLNIALLNAPNTGAGPYNRLPTPEEIALIEASDQILPSWEYNQEARYRARYAPMSVRILYRRKRMISWAEMQYHMAVVYLQIFGLRE